MENENRICLGAIVGVHGIRGEVKVKSFTEVAEDIDSYGPVEDKSGTKKFTIKVTGYSKGILRVKIKGVDDRNTSESLIGTEFYVSRDVLPDLEEEEFYHTDLIDLEVRLHTTGESIGKVSGIYNFGAGDVLEIKLKGGKLEMIPFTKEYVPEIKIKDGYIIVESAQLNFAEDEGEDIDNEG